ncbi:UNVERIFIED_CONTAM: IQ domain-containing protein IQM3 [Sesamum radiatum]|uniref:IQ domain-containing protein IQM3 n=1 Tax=Sesamum radiatum TaxID=300843 RepID=A0AAW2KS74_SESRA
MEVEAQGLSTFDLNSGNIPAFSFRNRPEFLVPNMSGSPKEPSELEKVTDDQMAEHGGEWEATAAPTSPAAALVGCPLNAAMKLQKVYRSYRTRRMLADSAVVAEELWWQALDFARLNHSTISFFNFLKPETAASRWNRVGLNASKVGKGLSEDAKAQKLAFQHWIEARERERERGGSADEEEASGGGGRAREGANLGCSWGEGVNLGCSWGGGGFGCGEGQGSIWAAGLGRAGESGRREGLGGEGEVWPALARGACGWWIWAGGTGKGEVWPARGAGGGWIWAGGLERGRWPARDWRGGWPARGDGVGGGRERAGGGGGGGRRSEGKKTIDPRHRYGHSLHFYYKEWCKTDAGQPFFYWLDLGDGKEVDLKECPRSKLRQQCIKYLGPIQMKITRIEMDFCDEHLQETLHWREKEGLFHHSSFLAGGATLAAGRLMAEDGVLKCISAYSGHYKPTDERLDSFSLFLKENGVNLDGVEIRKSNDDYENNENGKLSMDAAVSKVLSISDSVQCDLPHEEEDLSSEAPEVSKPETKNEYKRTLSGGLQSPKADVPRTSILQRINSKKAAKSYQLGHQLPIQWSTGVGPRIGCIADYPLELRLQALELTKLSPRTCPPLLTPGRSAALVSPSSCPPNISNDDMGPLYLA